MYIIHRLYPRDSLRCPNLRVVRYGESALKLFYGKIHRHTHRIASWSVVCRKVGLQGMADSLVKDTSVAVKRGIDSSR